MSRARRGAATAINSNDSTNNNNNRSLSQQHQQQQQQYQKSSSNSLDLGNSPLTAAAASIAGSPLIIIESDNEWLDSLIEPPDRNIYNNILRKTLSQSVVPTQSITDQPIIDQEYRNLIQLIDNNHNNNNDNNNNNNNNRILQLTNNKLINIDSNNNTIINQYLYSDIIYVLLIDPLIFTISIQLNHSIESLDITFTTIEACNIYEAINNRISINRSKQQLQHQHQQQQQQQLSVSNNTAITIESLTAKGIEFQTLVQRNSIHNGINNEAAVLLNQLISHQNSTPPNALTVSGDSVLTVDSDIDTDNNNNNNNISESTLSVLINSNSTDSVSTTTSPSNTNTATKIHRPKLSKLESLTGETESQRLSSALDQLLLDNNSYIGSARNKFIKNFGSSNNINNKNPIKYCNTIRQFLDSMVNYITIKQENQLKKLIGISTSTIAPDNSIISADIEQRNINRLIERSLQTNLLLPINNRIQLIIKKLTNNTDLLIRKQIELLKSKDQSWFGIELNYINNNNYLPAITVLSKLDNYLLPIDKLQCILNTAKNIYESYYNQKKAEEFIINPLSTINNITAGASTTINNTEYFLNGDQFFPIFVYITIQSAINNNLLLEYNRLIMSELNPIIELQGEYGYYLTVYEAALEYIKTIKIKSSNNNNNNNNNNNSKTINNPNLNQ